LLYNWFVGSLVGEQEKSIKIPLKFLDKKGRYEATIYFQIKEDLKNNIIQTVIVSVNSKTVLHRNLISNSGLAIIIKQTNN
jgi:hypothetical protein